MNSLQIGLLCFLIGWHLFDIYKNKPVEVHFIWVTVFILIVVVYIEFIK